MDKFKLETTDEFDKLYIKFIKLNKSLKPRIDSTMVQLISNPFYPGLKTHKVNTKNWGIKYSSRITGDLRIIWDFIDGKAIILVLTIGGHSGRKRVY